MILYYIQLLVVIKRVVNIVGEKVYSQRSLFTCKCISINIQDFTGCFLFVAASILFTFLILIFRDCKALLYFVFFFSHFL